MNTKYISKFFSGAIFSGILMIALFGISASKVTAQSEANITVKKDVCNSVNASNSCNGNNKSLQNQTINFTVIPNTNVSNIAVVINGGGGSNGSTTVGGFVEGVTYTVCEVIPNGFTSLPSPNGQQSASGSCIIATLGPGNNNLSFLNYLTTVGPTAARAMIAGRVQVENGKLRGGVLVTVLNTTTLETQTVLTNRLGYYEFEDLTVGDTYVMTVRGKGYAFTPQTFTLTEDSVMDMHGYAVSRLKP